LREPTISLEVFLVTDDVWCVRRPSYLACSYLFRSEEGLIAVDAGMDSSAADIFKGLQMIGASPEQLKAVLLTHWHNDHAAGASAIKSRLGVPVYYSAEEKPFLTRETAAHGLRAWLGERIPELGVLVLLRGLLEEAPPCAVEANSLLQDGDIAPGGLRVIATAGHTPGHVVYFHERRRILFCGDALAVVSGRLRLMSRPVTPDQEAARASTLRCVELSPETICPGHREPLTVNVAGQIERFRNFVKSDKPWPLLG
jgi:glyoxylase-like metal-dependent hydrolase (beta-lactamase superfamily II)